MIPKVPGHVMRFEKTENGHRWRCICTCGMGIPQWKGDTPPTYATEASAVGKAVWHMRKMYDAQTKDLRRDGIYVPSTTGQRRPA